MTRFTILFATLFALSSTIYSQEVELPKKRSKSFQPFDSKDLAVRYPVGKKWRSVSTFQATGMARSTNWGLTGEQNITIISRYSTVVEILGNQKTNAGTNLFGEGKCRCPRPLGRAKSPYRRAAWLVETQR